MRAFAFHPLADLFPLIEGAEFDELVASIKSNGLREPIVTYDGQILDGRNRKRACDAAGIEPRYTPFRDADPLQYVLDRNLKRRHLSVSQRASIAAEIETLRHGGGRKAENQEANLHLDRAAEATQLNVSQRSVATAAEVRDHGSLELKD